MPGVKKHFVFTPPQLKTKDVEQQGDRECVDQIIIESVDKTPWCCTVHCDQLDTQKFGQQLG